MLKPTQHVPAFTLFIIIKTKPLLAVDHVTPTQSSTFSCLVTHSNFTSVRLMCCEITWTCPNLWKLKSIFSNIFSYKNICSRAVIFMASVKAQWLYMVKLQLSKMRIYNTYNGSPISNVPSLKMPVFEGYHLMVWAASWSMARLCYLGGGKLLLFFNYCAGWWWHLPP